MATKRQRQQLREYRAVTTPLGVALEAIDDATGVAGISRLDPKRDPLSIRNRKRDPERAQTIEAAAYVRATLGTDDAGAREVGAVYADTLASRALELEQEHKDQYRQRQRQRRTGGQNKAGKLLGHNELIRRAMVYDQNRADTGDSEWINGPVLRRDLEKVLSLLEDEELLNELVEAEPRLALRRIEAFPDGNEDRTDPFVTFGYADRKDRDVAFSTLRNFIASVARTR